VHASELRDGVISVLHEHPVVELLRALHADARHLAALVDVLGELVEEQAAERLGRARVTREQRALHDLRQVHQREDGTVEVGEVPREHLTLVLGESLGREPERHGDGEGDGDGDAAARWWSTITVPGGTGVPGAVSCWTTLFGLKPHSGFGRTSSPS
jgi:hypothetical protein